MSSTDDEAAGFFHKIWNRAFPTGSGNRYRADYFCHLAYRFRMLPNPVDNPAAKAIAEEYLKRAEEIRTAGIRNRELKSIAWRDIHAFEHALISLLPDEALKAEAINLVARSADICGPTRAARWETAKLLSENDMEALRRGLLGIQAEAHQAQMERRAVEQTRSIAFTQCCFIIVVVLLVLCTIAWLLWGVDWRFVTQWFSKGAAPAEMVSDRVLPQAVMIACMGALGAGISKLLRITSIPADARPEGAGVQLQELRRQTGAAMLIGATAALVLFCAYAGDLLLVGELFPKVEPNGSSDSSRSQLALLFREPFKTSAALGKALFWSFVAGFSERFFQDTVDRLVGRSVEGKTPKA